MAKHPKRVSEQRAPRTYRLSAAKIARARKILGTDSDTATIEMALDLVTGDASLRVLRASVVQYKAPTKPVADGEWRAPR